MGKNSIFKKYCWKTVYPDSHTQENKVGPLSKKYKNELKKIKDLTVRSKTIKLL